MMAWHKPLSPRRDALCGQRLLVGLTSGHDREVRRHPERLS
ncbi:MAG: hypothetical protein WCA46_23740 [Actinocatenispora sp.]